MSISRFKASALDPGRPAAGRDPTIVPARVDSEQITGRLNEPIGRVGSRASGGRPRARGQAPGPIHTPKINGLAPYVNPPHVKNASRAVAPRSDPKRSAADP